MDEAGLLLPPPEGGGRGHHLRHFTTRSKDGGIAAGAGYDQRYIHRKVSLYDWTCPDNEELALSGGGRTFARFESMGGCPSLERGLRLHAREVLGLEVDRACVNVPVGIAIFARSQLEGLCLRRGVREVLIRYSRCRDPHPEADGKPWPLYQSRGSPNTTKSIP